jgi:hypothetical protein
MAEHKKTLIINMTRNRMPNAMHKYNNQGGLTPGPQSVQRDSTSEINRKISNGLIIIACHVTKG